MNNSGKVLIYVIGIMTLFTIIVTGLITSTISQIQESRRRIMQSEEKVYFNSLANRFTYNLNNNFNNTNYHNKMDLTKLEEIMKIVFDNRAKRISTDSYLKETHHVEDIKYYNLVYEWHENEKEYFETAYKVNGKCPYEVHILIEKEFDRPSTYYLYFRLMDNDEGYHALLFYEEKYTIMKCGTIKWF